MDDKIEYPAVLVLSRYGDNLIPPLFVAADQKVLRSDEDLDRRLATYRRLSDLGGLPYTYTLASVNDVDAVIERRRAELAYEHAPLQDPEPEPEPLSWDAAIDQAAELARAYFDGQNDAAALKRLPLAVDLAKARGWTETGDAANTWAFPGSDGRTYHVNGRCNCPDSAIRGVTWCKHRQARALARKAAELQKNGANGADTPKAPELAPTSESPTQTHDTTGIDFTQAARIDVAPHLRGSVVTYADGRQEPNPALFDDLVTKATAAGWVLPYRNSYAVFNPAYTKMDTSTAIPVDYSRGRAKLYK